MRVCINVYILGQRVCVPSNLDPRIICVLLMNYWVLCPVLIRTYVATSPLGATPDLHIFLPFKSFAPLIWPRDDFVG